MELEDQKQSERLQEDISCLEVSLNQMKNAKLRAKEEYKREKAHLEKNIEKVQSDLANLKKRSCECQLAEADKWFEEEKKKEVQRWKNLTPEEKIKEHRKRMETLRKENEDWEPMTDLMVDRWIEEENEKEMERLEKLEREMLERREEREREKLERREALQEAIKRGCHS